MTPIHLFVELADAPAELQDGIREFFPESEWEFAANIAWLESGFDAFAVLDSTNAEHPCGTPIGDQSGTALVSERSVGYFQINSCNFPSWEWQRLYNARHNAGTAHLIWSTQGWAAWFFSAKQIGLI